MKVDVALWIITTGLALYVTSPKLAKLFAYGVLIGNTIIAAATSAYHLGLL